MGAPRKLVKPLGGFIEEPTPILFSSVPPEGEEAFYPTSTDGLVFRLVPLLPKMDGKQKPCFTRL